MVSRRRETNVSGLPCGSLKVGGLAAGVPNSSDVPFAETPGFSYGEEAKGCSAGARVLYSTVNYSILSLAAIRVFTAVERRYESSHDAPDIVVRHPTLLALARGLGPLRLAPDVSIRNGLRGEQPQLGIAWPRSRELPLSKVACTVRRIPRDKPLT